VLGFWIVKVDSGSLEDVNQTRPGPDRCSNSPAFPVQPGYWSEIKLGLTLLFLILFMITFASKTQQNLFRFLLLTANIVKYIITKTNKDGADKYRIKTVRKSQMSFEKCNCFSTFPVTRLFNQTKLEKTVQTT
jgi:hypothetical protein